MFDLEDEKKEFQEREYRESYADEFLNTWVANQIRVLREQRDWSQKQLAEKIGTHQAGVSRIENVNYSGWNISTLKKIARAFDCRLHISFETYGSLLSEGANFSRRALERPTFQEDPAFKNGKAIQKSTIQRARVYDFPRQPQPPYVGFSDSNIGQRMMQGQRPQPPTGVQLDLPLNNAANASQSTDLDQKKAA